MVEDKRLLTGLATTKACDPGCLVGAAPPVNRIGITYLHQAPRTFGSSRHRIWRLIKAEVRHFLRIGGEIKELRRQTGIVNIFPVLPSHHEGPGA